MIPFIMDEEAEMKAIEEETRFWYRLCAILTSVHHLPAKGSPERAALIREIKDDRKDRSKIQKWT